MPYYFSTTLREDFPEALRRAREALQSEGFGIITEIDIQKTLREKIDADFRPYVILGACNPALAFDALQLEDKVGTMLPCNVVVQETPAGVEIAAIDPVASMQAIQNPELQAKAAVIADKLRRAMRNLGGRTASAQSETEAHRAQIERHAAESRRELESIAPPGTDPLHEGP